MTATVRRIATYLVVDNQKTGPYTDDELRNFVAHGRVAADALAWREGYAHEMRLCDIPELGMTPVFGSRPPTAITSVRAHEAPPTAGAMRATGVGRGVVMFLSVGAIVMMIALVIVMGNLRQSALSGGVESKISRTQVQLGRLQQSLQMFRIHNNRYPKTDEGLESLLSDPGELPAWRGPYVEEEQLRDLWGKAFAYQSDGRSVRIVSGGPDGTIGSADDIIYPE